MPAIEKTREELVEEIEKMRRKIELLEQPQMEIEDAKINLAHSESWYQGLFEDSPDGIFDVAADGTIMDANKAYLRLFGYSKEELFQTRIVNLYADPRDRAIYTNIINSDGYVRDYPMTLLRKNGEKIECEITATAQKNPQGKVLSYRGIIRDVTERNKSRAILESVQQNYRDLVEQTNSIILRWDREGKITFLNSFGLNFFRFTENEILGRNVIGTIVPETDMSGKDLIAMVVSIFNDPKRYEKNQNENMKSNGDRVWISWTNRPIYDENGFAKEILSIGNDHTDLRNAEEQLRKSKEELEIRVHERTSKLLETSERLRIELEERKKAEEAVRQSEKRFRTLIEKAPVAIAIARENAFIYSNPKFLEMLGYNSSDEFIEQPIFDLIAPEDLESFKERVRRRLLGLPAESNFELSALRRDGSLLYMSAAAALVDLPGGPANVGFFHDITDRIRSERALDESRNLLNVVVESLPVGVLYVDPLEKIVLANRMFAKWWDRPDENLSGKTVVEILGEHYHTIKASIKRALKGQRTSYYETVSYKDGVTRHVKTSYEPDISRNGEVRGFTCLVTDLSELRLAEKALRENQQRLELALSGAEMGTWDLDLRTGVVTPNVRSLKILGYSVDEFEPNIEFWQNLIHPEDLDGTEKGLRDAIEGRQTSLPPTYRVRSKSGDYKWLQSRGKVVERDRDGNALIMAGTLIDVTDQKKAEEDLREYEERNRLLIEESPVGIAIAQHGKFVYVNSEFMKIFGYGSPVEVLGLDTVDLVAPEYRDFVSRRPESVWPGSIEPRHYEVKGLRKDGSVFDLELWLRVFNYKGQRSLLAFCADRSEARSLRDQLGHAQKMEAVGTLAGGIAHDFNNLLQIILGYTELLIQRNQGNPGVKKDLARIMTAAENGADLVHMLMTFSRKTESRLVPTDLNERIQQIRTLLSRTIPKMIEIEMDLDDNLSTINADPVQVDQILMNLAVNARDAMPDGGKLLIETEDVTLDNEFCRTRLGLRPGQYVLLTISDTGSGIDKESLEHIFEPFFTTKGLGKGTGLGLAMVFGIVHHHGGHISCYSEPGLGTTFKIYFPSNVSEKNQVSREVYRKPEMLVGNETVMIVDDEQSIRDFCEEILVDHGYTVITAVDGFDAIDVFKRRKDKIDIVILDMIMPNMDGRQCLEELLKLDATLKVVLATGYSLNSQMWDFFSGRIKGSVTKPFKVTQLLQSIRNAMSASETA